MIGFLLGLVIGVLVGFCGSAYITGYALQRIEDERRRRGVDDGPGSANG